MRSALLRQNGRVPQNMTSQLSFELPAFAGVPAVLDLPHMAAALAAVLFAATETFAVAALLLELGEPDPPPGDQHAVGLEPAVISAAGVPVSAAERSGRDICPPHSPVSALRTRPHWLRSTPLHRRERRARRLDAALVLGGQIQLHLLQSPVVRLAPLTGGPDKR